MRTDSGTKTKTRYVVEVFSDDESDWVELPGFSSDDLDEAKRGYDSINGKPYDARVVEVETYTKISETQVWPAEWTDQPDLCHYNGLADHDWHVISRERKQFCRGNGPGIKDRHWKPTDVEASARRDW